MEKVDISIEYRKVSKCPGCGCDLAECENLGPICIDSYKFGRIYRIKAGGPAGCISIRKCQSCNLIFKDYVPEPEALFSLFHETTESVWNKSHDYEDEIAFVSGIYGDKKISLLDVGASNGELLKRLKPLCFRCSALDVVENKSCKSVVDGEYIQGMLDGETIDWSGETYDFVTVFDVVEHLYDVEKGFKNLRSFLSEGGYVLIKTGDASSKLPTKHGLNHWWYISRVEHHVAFTSQCLHYLAEKTGFRVVSITQKHHKDNLDQRLMKKVLNFFRSVFYAISPHLYTVAVGILFSKRNIIQPRPVFEKDHMQILLQRIA